MPRYYLVLSTTYFQLAYQNEYMPFRKTLHCALYLASVFPLYEWCLVIKAEKALLSFIGMKWNSCFSLCWLWLTELRSKESVPRPLCCQVTNMPSSLALSCRLWPQGRSLRGQFSERCLNWDRLHSLKSFVSLRNTTYLHVTEKGRCSLGIYVAVTREMWSFL